MKVIQIGIGGMGNAWLRAVQASPEVTYSGFVEINERVIDEQVERNGLDRSLIFPSLEIALQSVPTDGVINVTPPQFHRDVSILALEAGVPVLSEKPLADTLQAAQDIVDAANRTGVLHMVTQNYRYSLPALTLKHALQTADLGQIGAVTVGFFRGPHFGGFREEMPYPLIIDMSIHHFDMMRYFLDLDPIWIYGRSWNPPWSWFNGDASASVLLRFEGDVTVAYNGSWCSQGMDTPWNGEWRFECERGVVTLHNDQVTVYRTGEAPEPVEPVAAERVAQAYLLHEFYEAVTTGKIPATTCQDNIKSLAIVFNTVKSFETGSPVAVPAAPA
jgi:predicted dehydrogenase